jgi:tRNA pseudouridine13 synthase
MVSTEEELGLELYASSCQGMGGRIKSEPEDFIVEEISEDGILEVGVDKGDKLDEPKEYTTFTLEKKNWEALRAINMLSKKCGSSRKRFKFAGTKDRRSVSTTRVSAWKIPPERLKAVNLKDISLHDFAYSDEPVNLGCLKGNRFTITILGVSDDADKRVSKVVKELDGKAPNFFGTQRFGNRHNTHKVGRAILQGDFEKAVMMYLTDTGDEPEAAMLARKELAETQDFKKALLTFPDYLGYEKSLLNHLVNYQNDYIGAMRKLPKKLRWLFVHAYQGYIFNRALSGHIKESEYPESLVLMGKESEADKRSLKILEEDGLSPSSFNVSAMPECSSRGETRQCFISFWDFKVMDFNKKENKIILRFSLPPGSYATVLLRELMKN